MLAKKAVSLFKDEPLRAATRAARWKLSKTVVDAYKALYVKIHINKRERKIVVMPRSNRCVKVLSAIISVVVVFDVSCACDCDCVVVVDVIVVVVVVLLLCSDCDCDDEDVCRSCRSCCSCCCCNCSFSCCKLFCCCCCCCCCCINFDKSRSLDILLCKELPEATRFMLPKELDRTRLLSDDTFLRNDNDDACCCCRSQCICIILPNSIDNSAPISSNTDETNNNPDK
mmetsp:Transcript_19090/g.28797  ORF Transcript_19090/g.28797 Transcript_19090/m.28797 type:complete len:228 (+) Transcript_19090:401-1084(+)